MSLHEILSYRPLEVFPEASIVLIMIFATFCAVAAIFYFSIFASTEWKSSAATAFFTLATVLTVVLMTWATVKWLSVNEENAKEYISSEDLQEMAEQAFVDEFGFELVSDVNVINYPFNYEEGLRSDPFLVRARDEVKECVAFPVGDKAELQCEIIKTE